MSQLPRGWVETNFEDVCDYIQRGKGPKYAEFSEYPVVNQKAVRWFGIQEEHLKYVHPEQWDKWDELRYIREGDILWNSTGTGTIGRACHIDQTQLSKAKVVDSHITIVRTNKLVESKFAFYWIMHPEIQGNINGLYNGSTNQVELSKKIIESTRFPLAPLAEQTCIVKKLDEVLAQVEATQARLARIPDIIKLFRQSVLSAAVSGKLTEEWRIKHANTPWLDGVLGDFINKPTYGSSAKSDKDGLVPVLRMGNLQNGKLDWTELVYTSDEVEIKKYKLRTGDVLFNRTNSPELVGKTSIYRGERTAIYAGYLIKISCLPVLNPEFLNYHLNSPSARAYCYAVKSDGVSQSNINAKKLAEYPMSLPQPAEQTEIVRRVEQLFTYADSIEQQAKAAKARVDNLTQAILAKAFRGELTADWRAANPDLISGDNSAAALLARIQAERATASGKKGKRGTSKTRTTD
ncbi:restriction endonuclease subunit S [Aeromonas caviae]|uniref:restriction endonuclease subunit S n=1 Tax=Aeromonas caviae TaxID=648 RepID=UPI001FB97FC8|nr:restriction endonuclease subunit S [Aeromonas caviae]MEA9443456.1 restriction endonuclease subunit S [Aeromonas caviae]GKR18631.1 type I restriction endonuclease EcoKI subunit S [Aeromonas caviae]GKR44422.1 type I restriction endonuclease EcoKI subunit S [Aeromonas caviae]GKR51807.1 type I restriction endonuclease EcoKI subunit S [Aeromonas caviae]GKR61229.1 type I restriction endonuclease EcoKI subunit S [Aeromonas caviae]